MSSYQKELTRTVAKLMADAIDNGFKSGFYAASAMAGLSIEECEENWKKFTKPQTSEDEK